MEDWVALVIASVVSYIAGFVMGRWTRRTKTVDKYTTPTEKMRDGHSERKWEAFEFEGQILYRLR